MTCWNRPVQGLTSFYPTVLLKKLTFFDSAYFMRQNIFYFSIRHLWCERISRKIKTVALPIRERAASTKQSGEPLISGIPERAAFFMSSFFVLLGVIP